MREDKELQLKVIIKNVFRNAQYNLMSMNN